MVAKDFSDKARDIANQAKDFTDKNSDKIKDALNSDQAEAVSDKVLGGVAGLANKITGGKHSDKIEDVRKNLDDKFGNE